MNPIAYYRKRSGLTQAALGAQLNVSKQLVSAWESGRANIDPKYMEGIKNALGLDETVVLSLVDRAFQNSARTQGAPLPTCYVVSENAVANWNTVFFPVLDLIKNSAEDHKLPCRLGLKGDFIIRVSGDDLLPWFPQGTLLLVRPHAHLETGDHLIIVRQDGTIGAALYTELANNCHLLRYEGQSAKDQGFKKEEFPADLRAVYRIIQKANTETALQLIDQDDSE